MSYNNDDKNMIKVQSFIGLSHYEKLQFYSKFSKLPMSRLIAIALDNEFQKEKPFFWDVNLPEDDYVEYAFANEAGKIVEYLRSLEGRGMSLDLLVLVREDMGIKEKKNLLLGFRECLKKELIEAYTIKDNRRYDPSMVFYRLKGYSPKAVKQVKKKVSDFTQYQRLKKKFKNE